MSTPSQQRPEALPVDAFWLNAVQTLTACNMLAIFVPFAVALIYDPRDSWYLGFFLSLTPFWAPFVWVFWRLTGRRDALTIKRNLALAASWAFLIFVPSSMLLSASVNESDSARIIANSAIIVTIQVALILSSVKAYLSMKRESADFYLLIPRLGTALFVLACIALFLLRFGRVRY